MTAQSKFRVKASDKFARIKPLPDPPKEPDAMQQLPDIIRAVSILADSFRSRSDVLVSGEGYLCLEYRQGYARLVPDCLVAFGVEPADIEFRNGYVISEVGKPPELALEVASSSTGERDVEVKRGIYASFGVSEYWRFDRTGGDFHGTAMAGDLLVDGEYQPIEVNTGADGVVWGRSPVLGLDLCWYEGRLRFYDPATQEYLPELMEAKEQARAAEARAAEAEARAAEAEAEAQRLREELRRRAAD